MIVIVNDNNNNSDMTALHDAGVRAGGVCGLAGV